MVDENFIEEYRKKLDAAGKKALEEGYVTEELNKKQYDNEMDLSKKRGYLLNRMTEIEHSLNLVLTTYFVDFDKFFDFQNLILGKEFFTLFQKINLFKELKIHKKEEFGNKFDGLTGVLLDLMKIRNIVAHGFKVHGTKPIVCFLGTDKHYTIDKDFMDDFSNKFQIAFYCLNELYSLLVSDSMDKKLKETGLDL